MFFLDENAGLCHFSSRFSPLLISMYLKNLQILGFKSFADTTHIEFLPGVTAIVGPNGCGKSNVADAIRWVLGEQSAKALRGDEMAAVIFNGVETRKPLGMAEVSVTFADCKDALRTGQLAGMDTNFDEVTVTRRIFHDGNSDYLINKTPCRLKDVQSVFMDTGIGRPSYSFMEQGKIDRVLSAQPEDRRAVFEEAAGITKFKTQKKEALRKLEYTEINLTRVVDIIREVKRQIGSLQRQAGKARRYQALLTELKRLDSQLARHEFEETRTVIHSLEKEADELRAKMDNVRLQIETGEGNVRALREQIAGAETRRQQALQQQRALDSEIDRLEIRTRTNTDRIAETETAIRNSLQQIAEAKAKIVELQKAITANHARRKTASDQLAAQTENLDQAQTLLQKAEATVKEQENVIQQIQGRQLGIEGAVANLRTEAATREKQRQELGFRLLKLNSERSVASEERQKLIQRLDSLRAEVGAYKQTFAANREAVTGGEEALVEAERQCQILTAEIAAEQRLLSEKTSRCDILRQLQESYEGYSEGAQSLLRRLANPLTTPDDSRTAPAIAGTLVNLIEVEPRFSAAIEAALGQCLQAIVVPELQAALVLAGQMREHDLGRALFAIGQDASSVAGASHPPRQHLPGSAGWASDAVRARSPVADLVKRLLADTALVQDLNQAVALHKDHPGLSFVTIEGDTLDHHGILSAGSHRVSPVSLIGRRNEITALETTIAQLENRLRDISTKKGEWEGRRDLARRALGDRQSELRLQETDLTRKETLLETLQNELREQETRISTVNLESQDLDRHQHENEADLARIRSQLAQAETGQESTHAELSAARQQISEMAAERHDRGAVVNDLRVARATLDQQIQGLETQLQPLEIQTAEKEQFIAARESDIRDGRQRIAQWQAANGEADLQVEKLRQAAAEVTAQVTRLEAQKSVLESQTQVAAETLHELRAAIDAHQKQWTDVEIALTEKRGNLSHLCERLQREHGIDLAAVTMLPLGGKAAAKRTRPAEISDESPPSVESSDGHGTNGAEALPADEDQNDIPPSGTGEPASLEFDSWDEVAARLVEARAKIQAMGPINVEAVQEYDELQQRHTFLTREHDDLVLSKEQLLEILRKINATTRKLFSETFAKVRENFQSVYTELFGGGRADLTLMDESDPLECGIEIVAKPPGKQLQSIMLLSGGEKAMTAVALLFAIYMVKPSPFCVLDEVDAPLDESNINRFTKMLDRFLGQSQFVIITHNKRTIAMADAIYGVTMEERGVSKLLSVKFHHKADGNANSGNGNGSLIHDQPTVSRLPVESTAATAQLTASPVN